MELWVVDHGTLGGGPWNLRWWTVEPWVADMLLQPGP